MTHHRFTIINYFFNNIKIFRSSSILIPVNLLLELFLTYHFHCIFFTNFVKGWLSLIINDFLLPLITDCVDFIMSSIVTLIVLSYQKLYSILSPINIIGISVCEINFDDVYHNKLSLEF